MGNCKPTQCDRVYKYMQDFGSINQAQAFNDLGVYRLASRISEMRLNGIKIVSKMVKSKNRYGEPVHYSQYSLVKEIKEVN